MADRPQKYARSEGGGSGRGGYETGAGCSDNSGTGGGVSGSAEEGDSSVRSRAVTRTACGVRRAVTANVSDGEEPATNALLWPRYIVTSNKLGRGAQGTAYSAIDTETEELPAVKKVDPSTYKGRPTDL